jgi:hypothetical protein
VGLISGLQRQISVDELSLSALDQPMLLGHAIDRFRSQQHPSKKSLLASFANLRSVDRLMRASTNVIHSDDEIPER